MCYLLSMKLSQVAESNGESLGVVLMDPEVYRLQAAHVEEQLGLLQSHGAEQNTGGHMEHKKKLFYVNGFCALGKCKCVQRTFSCLKC